MVSTWLSLRYVGLSKLDIFTDFVVWGAGCGGGDGVASGGGDCFEKFISE